MVVERFTRDAWRKQEEHSAAPVRKAGTTARFEPPALFLPSGSGQAAAVIQEREIDRVGGTRPIPIDFRVIAAINRNL